MKQLDNKTIVGIFTSESGAPEYLYKVLEDGATVSSTGGIQVDAEAIETFSIEEYFKGIPSNLLDGGISLRDNSYTRLRDLLDNEYRSLLTLVMRIDSDIVVAAKSIQGPQNLYLCYPTDGDFLLVPISEDIYIDNELEDAYDVE